MSECRLRARVWILISLGRAKLSLDDQVDPKLSPVRREGAQLIQLSLRHPPAPAHCGLLRCSPEEVVLQRVVRSDPRLGVILQHPEDQILESEIVRHTVTWLTQASATRTTRLDAENVVNFSRSGASIFLFFRDIENIGTIGEFVKVFLGLRSLVQDVFWREPEDLNYFIDLIHLVLTGEERLARVHLDEDAAEAPHVDGEVIRDPEQDLRAAIESALNVLVDTLSQLARGTKVDNFDSTSLRVTKENIFWFQITVDDF